MEDKDVRSVDLDSPDLNMDVQSLDLEAIDTDNSEKLQHKQKSL